MGFKDSVSASYKDAMTAQQARMVVNLYEQFDGVRKGCYAEYELPKWNKSEASAEIERLQRKIREKT